MKVVGILNKRARNIHILMNENFLLITVFAAFTTNVICDIFQSIYSIIPMCAFWFSVLLYNNSFINKDALYRKGKYDGEKSEEFYSDDKLYFLGHNIGSQKRMKQVYEEYGHWNDET